MSWICFKVRLFTGFSLFTKNTNPSFTTGVISNSTLLSEANFCSSSDGYVTTIISL